MCCWINFTFSQFPFAKVCVSKKIGYNRKTIKLLLALNYSYSNKLPNTKITTCRLANKIIYNFNSALF